ncbi:MAG: alpha/beta fold hydrolase [Rhodospirillaceae bacterium]|nr:alpha/beta fold hydrolase [Rhodospirillaceae bacterium]
MRKGRTETTPRIAFSHAGSGEPLLFLHGIGGNRDNWDEQLAAFAPHFHAIAWDARGYGDSDDDEGPASIDLYADDVARVLDHFGYAAAHIAGLSIGGRIAQRFYFRHPQRVLSLALIDTRADTGGTRTPEQREEFFRMRAKPLLDGKTPADIAPEIARSLMGPQSAPATFDRLVASMRRLRRDSYLKAIRANLDEDYPGDPSRIAAPTIVIVGGDDRLTPPASSRSLAAMIPGARYHEIAGAGHLSNIDRPHEFNATLLDFLLGLRRG